MPKIIEHIRENLLKEARKQVMEQGYSAMTIRSVAGACGVGVGTVYNYFPSKDMLVASFMLEDWEQCKETIEIGCKEAMKGSYVITTKAEKTLRCVYDGLLWYMEKYIPLFQDENASISFAASFHQRHKQLRDQLAKPLKALCETQTKAEPQFLAEFLAESMLTWTQTGRTFEEICGVLMQLF